jgi:hypothetical protein
MNDDMRLAPRRLVLLLQFTAFASTLLGLKLWLIHSYGNEVPYWDQWDAEAAGLYVPFLRGELSWSELLAPHNEHRIFTTRILGLLLFQLNGLWSPLLEMVVNAVLHVLALGTAVWLMAKAANKRSLAVLLLFALLLFAIPFGWENTLAGFQAQFYFVLLFSVLSIWWLIAAQALSRWWWLGIASAVAAYFSLASGVFALAAASVALLLRFAIVSRDRRELLGALLLLVLFLAGVFTTPVLEQHAQLKASDAKHFFKALSLVLAWPFQISPEALEVAAEEWPSLKEWLLVVARNLPAAALVCCLLWKRSVRSAPAWFLLALAIWFGGQAAAVAYGRSNDALTSRYLDLHAMGVLVNFACLVAICAGSRRWPRRGATVVGCLWVLATMNALLGTAAIGLPLALEGKRDTSSAQESNVSAYLAGEDREKFRALPFLQLPYPNADRLAKLLDSPETQRILPKNLQRPLEPAAVMPPTGAVFERVAAFHAVPSCHCLFWTSYGAMHGAAMGETFLRYDLPVVPERPSRVFVLKVAGYPRTAGGIEIIQGGKVTRLRFSKEPGETWVDRYFSVRPGEPFFIRLIDRSATGWFAMRQPMPAGRMDRWISALLESYGTFFAIGVAAVCLLFLSLLRPDNEAAPSDSGPNRGS